MLALADVDVDLGHRTSEVAELVGLSATRVRHYVRVGLVTPARGLANEYRFSFRDIVVLRTARELLDANVPVRKANRVLRKLKGDIDRHGSLTALRIVAEGDEVLVRDDSARWNPETGQGHLDFSVDRLAGNVAPFVRDHLQGQLSERVREDMDSDDWYNLALDLEDVSPDEAPDAYRKSLELNPNNVDALVNLGRLTQLGGGLVDAARLYRQALDLDPDHQLAMYNLGTVYDERDQLDEAMSWYLRATAVADAHYNLARLYELQGNELAAVRHMKRYAGLID